MRGHCPGRGSEKKISYMAGYCGNCRICGRSKNAVMNASNGRLKLVLGQQIYTFARQSGN